MHKGSDNDAQRLQSWQPTRLSWGGSGSGSSHLLGGNLASGGTEAPSPQDCSIPGMTFSARWGGWKVMCTHGGPGPLTLLRKALPELLGPWEEVAGNFVAGPPVTRPGFEVSWPQPTTTPTTTAVNRSSFYCKGSMFYRASFPPCTAHRWIFDFNQCNINNFFRGYFFKNSCRSSPLFPLSFPPQGL